MPGFKSLFKVFESYFLMAKLPTNSMVPMQLQIYFVCPWLHSFWSPSWSISKPHYSVVTISLACSNLWAANADILSLFGFSSWTWPCSVYLQCPVKGWLCTVLCNSWWGWGVVVLRSRLPSLYWSSQTVRWNQNTLIYLPNTISKNCIINCYLPMLKYHIFDEVIIPFLTIWR